MLVGDSLSKNMWVSLTCLLHASVPNSSYTIDCTGLLSTFTMPVYIYILVFSFFFCVYHSSPTGKSSFLYYLCFFVFGLVGVWALSFVVEKWVPCRCDL